MCKDSLLKNCGCRLLTPTRQQQTIRRTTSYTISVGGDPVQLKDCEEPLCRSDIRLRYIRSCSVPKRAIVWVLEQQDGFSQDLQIRCFDTQRMRFLRITVQACLERMALQKSCKLHRIILGRPQTVTSIARHRLNSNRPIQRYQLESL